MAPSGARTVSAPKDFLVQPQNIFRMSNALRLMARDKRRFVSTTRYRVIRPGYDLTAE
jgi:hypothetical protein